MKYLIAVFLIAHLSIGTFAASQAEFVLKANKAYTAGSYAEAADQYNKVIQAGFEAPELFYNLGNTYFKMHDYASAILWYERAKRLDPGNEDINFNLNVANTRISDKIEPLPELFYKRWFRGLVSVFSADTWAVGAFAFLSAGLVFLAFFLVSRVLIIRKAGFWMGVASIVAAIFLLTLAWAGNSYMTSSSYAIVFAPTITVKSSPDDRSTDLFVIHEGAKVMVLDNISGWYEIRIANGSVGWLPVTAVTKI